MKKQIIELTRRYSELAHADLGTERSFEPGQTTVPYAGRVFDHHEVVNAVSSTLDFWLTLGPEGDLFADGLAQYLGAQRSLLVNSGSSANLLAVSALTSHRLPEDRRLKPGDEVITCAAGFPTTVTPIVQCGAVPVFVDNDPVTGNVRVDQLEEAYVEGKTKAVVLAHTLGNPFDIAAVLSFCRAHKLWLVEDNCDALGCTYTVPEALQASMGLGRGQLNRNLSAGVGELTLRTGAWGDISSQSFYPPHHLTMGEGGAVNAVSSKLLATVLESLRDWGRDCYCPSGCDNSCNKRFGWQLGELPFGYDHKYIYSHLGYNLKPLDPQAAIGRAQLDKLPRFVTARHDNWEYLRRGLDHLGHLFEFSLPTHATGWDKDRGFSWDSTGCRVYCSWFGFMLRVRRDAPFSRSDLAKHLDEKKIGNRMLFGGNLTRQPAFVQLRKDRPGAMRTVGDLAGADDILDRALFVGTFPGLTRPMLDYIIEVIDAYVNQHAGVAR
ncbi:MAG: lipopolysaccharide biosynthesis protein RfbH [Planctomycetota bacterium]